MRPNYPAAKFNTWFEEQGLLGVKCLWCRAWAMRLDIRSFALRANLMSRPVQTRTLGGVVGRSW